MANYVAHISKLIKISDISKLTLPRKSDKTYMCLYNGNKVSALLSFLYHISLSLFDLRCNIELNNTVVAS